MHPSSASLRVQVALLALATLAGCTPGERHECVRSHLCVALPPGGSVSVETTALAGRLEGERVALAPGGGTYVLSPSAGITLEVHQLWLDGALVFDVQNAERGIAPRVDVRPTGEPPVLLLAGGWTRAEVLVRPSGAGSVDIVRVSPSSGAVLRIDLHRLDESLDEARARDALVRAGALLGIAIDARIAPIDPALREVGARTSYDAASLAGAVHAAPGRVPLFLVPRGGGTSVGSTPSVPLSPLDGDRAVVVEARADADAMSRSIAHELGHALGLLHVSEANGWLLEGLDDTATCLVDTDGDGALRPIDCPEAAANLMYWQDAGGTALSPAQRARLRRSALLF